MNCRADNRYVEIDEALQADIDRIFSLWGDSLTRHGDGGPWLLGEFSIADAMYTPVVIRLKNYGIPVPSDIGAYCKYVLEDEDVRLWCEQASGETWIVEADEAGVDRGDG